MWLVVCQRTTASTAFSFSLSPFVCLFLSFCCIVCLFVVCVSSLPLNTLIHRDAVRTQIFLQPSMSRMLLYKHVWLQVILVSTPCSLPWNVFKVRVVQKAEEEEVEDNDGVGGEKMHIYGGGSLLLRIPRNEKKKKKRWREIHFGSLFVSFCPYQRHMFPRCRVLIQTSSRRHPECLRSLTHSPKTLEKTTSSTIPIFLGFHKKNVTLAW